MDEYKVMDHVGQHCRKVAGVALFIADKLTSAGVKLNIRLIEAAALLHDITKIEALEQGRNHAETGADLLEKLGFPTVAHIVRQHVNLSGPIIGTPINESEVVNYADKRVLHTTVVSLRDRFDYIREKYGHGDPVRITRINRIEEETQELEKKIFARLPIKPEEIP
ncbi:MAG: HD domain-containing protein [Thermodesulfobacteriota bacterium]